jgi:hypothetical protein
MQEYTRDTFQRLSSFEILLRRVVRWELMSSDGRAWMLGLGNYFDEIDRRVKNEKNAGLYSNNSSELSYLTLTELLRLIFTDLWHEKFKLVFSGDKGLSKLITNSVVPLRNKLAHFRPIEGIDLINLSTIHDTELILKNFYSNKSSIEFYLSSEPDWVEEMLDEDNISQIQDCLNKYDLNGLLDDFWKVDSIRTSRFFPGMGLYKGHIFIELHYFQDSPKLDIDSWINNNKFEVTLITQTASKLRFFWPVVNGKNEIKKGFNSLQKLVNHSLKNNVNINMGNICMNEYFVNQLSNRSFGVAL